MPKKAKSQSETVDFKSKAAVFRWLEKEHPGTVSRSQFYDHCRDGKLRPLKGDKGYTLKAVRRYVKLHLGKDETLDKLAMRKKQIAVERDAIRLSRERYEFEVTQKKYIPAEAHELGMVGRGIAFMAHIKHTILMRTPEYVELVGGDQEKAELLADTISADIEKRMSIFAGGNEFDVILEGNAP